MSKTEKVNSTIMDTTNNIENKTTKMDEEKQSGGNKRKKTECVKLHDLVDTRFFRSLASADELQFVAMVHCLTELRVCSLFEVIQNLLKVDGVFKLSADEIKALHPHKNILKTWSQPVAHPVRKRGSITRNRVACQTALSIALKHMTMMAAAGGHDGGGQLRCHK